MKHRRLFICIATIFLAGIGAATGGCSKPSAKIVGVKMQDVSLASATLVFSINVENPNAVALPITSLDYSLASDGVEFIDGDANVQGNIPANGSKIIDLPVRIKFIDLIKALKSLKNISYGSTIPYTASMAIKANVPIFGETRLPMTKNGELKIPSKESLLNNLRDLVR